MTLSDAYSILGISQSESLDRERLRHIWRRRLIESHPDNTAGDSGKVKETQDIITAYHLLRTSLENTVASQSISPSTIYDISLSEYIKVLHGTSGLAVERSTGLRKPIILQDIQTLTGDTHFFIVLTVYINNQPITVGVHQNYHNRYTVPLMVDQSLRDTIANSGICEIQLLDAKRVLVGGLSGTLSVFFRFDGLSIELAFTTA